MNGSSTQTFETPTLGRGRRLNDEVVSVIVAVGLTFLAGLWMFPEPDRVDVLSVSNPSEYRIGVFVSPADGGSGSALSRVDADTTRVYSNVLDQGERWAFAFSSQGFDAGVLVLDRSALESQGWAVEVPADVIDALRSAEVPLPPQSAQRGP